MQRALEYIRSLKMYFPGYSTYVSLLIFIGIGIKYNYHQILFKAPQSIHLWRQADCLSLTANYYQDDNPFLEPSVHHLGNDETGKTMSEFPLLHYIVAQIWKVSGQKEYIFRGLVLLIFSIGLFALFKAIEKRFQNSLWAILIPLFLLTSPTLAYYANNFLMNIPALGLALLGLAFFLNFERTKKKGHLIVCILVYTLAALLKVTAYISFLAIIGLFALEWIGVRLREEKIFTHKWLFLGLTTFSVAVVFGWYKYAEAYNLRYNAGNFLVGILPIWRMSNEAILLNIDTIFNYHFKANYFNMLTTYIFLVIGAFLMVFYKRVSRLFGLLSVITLLGITSYAVLFFDPLKDHDYYAINLFIAIPIFLITVLDFAKRNIPFSFLRWTFFVGIALLFMHNMNYASKRLGNKYDIHEWENEGFHKHYRHYISLRNHLSDFGIEKDDRIVCFSDYTINAALYFLNQKGWSKYGTHNAELIDEKIDMGANYLIITHEDKKNHPELKRFYQEPVGSFEVFEIYKIENVD